VKRPFWTFYEIAKNDELANGQQGHGKAKSSKFKARTSFQAVRRYSEE